MNNPGVCSIVVEELRDMLTQERSARIKAEVRAEELERQLQQAKCQHQECTEELDREQQRTRAMFGPIPDTRFGEID
ncbi:hypothetical protein SH449x_004426 [Pirellulaceae bacterium SH449]